MFLSPGTGATDHDRSAGQTRSCSPRGSCLHQLSSETWYIIRQEIIFQNSLEYCKSFSTNAYQGLHNIKKTADICTFWLPLLDKVNIISSNITQQSCVRVETIFSTNTVFLQYSSIIIRLFTVWLQTKVFKTQNYFTHLWGPSLLRDSVLGGLCPSALLHSDFWVCTQPAWSSRRQHAVSRSWWENISLENISIHLL